MFRRKEDSLFDSSTDTNQAESTESASAASSSPAPTPASNSKSSASPAYLNKPAPRSSSEARPASSAPAASSFRPTNNPSSTSDLSRNRLPEAKASPATTAPATASSYSIGNKQGNRILTVGNDILLKGEIATCDRLVIEGKVDATLNDVHTVEIAENGSFKGSAHIEDAEISGLFEGDLAVRNRLVIHATGKVCGNITYGEVEIERGGELTGEIKTNNPASQTSSSRPARAKEAA